jgi:hypothetical protein
MTVLRANRARTLPKSTVRTSMRQVSRQPYGERGSTLQDVSLRGASVLAVA